MEKDMAAVTYYAICSKCGTEFESEEPPNSDAGTICPVCPGGLRGVLYLKKKEWILSIHNPEGLECRGGEPRHICSVFDCHITPSSVCGGWKIRGNKPGS
jgi:DNA-directed RNA polymerase subunit RPC12/RpoP